MLAQLTVLGGFWPPNSLLNKFRRFCHRNEAQYPGLAGYCGKPKSFTSPLVLSSFADYYWGLL